MTHTERVISNNKSIAEALRTVYDALNQGQQKKLLKEKEVRELLERYGVVEVSGDG